ncbi:unnamed protein product [Lactuca virosa]|uniref:Uncharacterized protein n=1 Tax=Lactuca virosa TaxID=75947 RepID=A0AAU9P4M1_9ASTR|nr:unnamed protein product [Lactuca virosa]
MTECKEAYDAVAGSKCRECQRHLDSSVKSTALCIIALYHRPRTLWIVPLQHSRIRRRSLPPPCPTYFVYQSEDGVLKGDL